jgi:hypothetical protein
MAKDRGLGIRGGRKKAGKEIRPITRLLMAYSFGSMKIWRKIDLLRNVLIGLVLIAMILVSVAFGADTSQKDALAAAENWLAMIDHGEYAKSWQEAAAYFKTVITEGEWVQSMQEVRKPLGKLISRKVKSLTPKTSLPNTPKGEYVVIQFETSFEKGKSGLETVTPQLERDGKWRVAGYHIQWQ